MTPSLLETGIGVDNEAVANAEYAIQGRQCGPYVFTARNKFRPEWSYFVPQGYRDEPFDVAWSFIVPQDGAIHSGYPIQLDDDAPYIVRGFISSSLIGLGFGLVYDAYGRPLMDGLAYNFGGWGFGGFAWPVDQELICPAGGLLRMDFQLANNGGTATIEGCFLGVKRRIEC